MRDVITLRDGTPGDAPLLAEFDPVVARGDRQRVAEIERALAEGSVRVAVTAGDPVGYCVTRGSFFGQPFVELLIVAERAWRQGVGTRLLDDAVERCPGDRIFTSTNLSNAAMTQLLGKTGWASAGVVYGLDPGDPELIFLRTVDAA